jgi:2,3-bisphosphoglycerate-independent phosphoglycerate mutase
MSAYEVTEELVGRIRAEKYDVIILNYANMDMVGHTGIFEAALKAVEVLDECVGKVISEIENVGGEALITADHGNAEKMEDPDTGQPHTAHTSNPVRCICVSRRINGMRDGILADISPTILAMLGISQPPEMNGKSLIE